MNKTRLSFVVSHPFAKLSRSRSFHFGQDDSMDGVRCICGASGTVFIAAVTRRGESGCSGWSAHGAHPPIRGNLTLDT